MYGGRVEREVWIFTDTKNGKKTEFTPFFSRARGLLLHPILLRAWESTYDIWDSNNANETMLWMNYTGTATGGGNVKPISFNYDASGNDVPVFTNVTVGGHTWNVFRGNNGTRAR